MSEQSGDAVGVGMIGHAFMGAVHSHAWRNVHRFFDVGKPPRMVVLGGRDERRTKESAATFGWQAVETDWRALIERDDISVVDICTPGDTHAEIAIAALAAGKHVLCEKPLANTLDEAQRMAAAAREASARGVRAMVAFNYRRVPALALARKLVAEGRLGTIRHVRASYLQDWLADPASPMSWRLRSEQAGSGALGDIGAHIVDAARFVTGDELIGLSAMTNTFVPSRPVHDGQGAGLERVTVDDCALLFGRFDSGAVASFEATRYALGRKNAMRLEINGSAGSLSFDFEAMNELWFCDGTDPAGIGGFRRILTTEVEHPYIDAWWPPGHLLGYEHTFVHEVADFLRAVRDREQPVPGFDDGVAVQQVLDAAQRSAGSDSSWVEIDPGSQLIAN